MSYYPVIETEAFYIDKITAAYIQLMAMQNFDKVLNAETPLIEKVQAILKTEKFEQMIKGEISEEEFMELCPDYAEIEELSPYYFLDPDMDDVKEILDIEGVDVTYVRSFEGTIEPIHCLDTSSLTAIQKDLTDEEPLLYLRPNKAKSYFKAAYTNLEELKMEYRYRLGKLLPDDFDYEIKICNFFGVDFSEEL